MVEDKTKSESREPTVDAALEQEVMSALLDPGKLSVDEIDELLTRCAGEALRLQADRKRTESAVRALEAERLRLFEVIADNALHELESRMQLAKAGHLSDPELVFVVAQ
jgi:hypothetical protein